MPRIAARMLADARRASGLSQAELADRAGIQRTALTMYETGARIPGADAFVRLMTATGAPVYSGRAGTRIDCWRNSEVFASLATVLDAVPAKAPGPLRYPAEVWRRNG